MSPAAMTDAAGPELTIVIVSYNTKAMTLEAIGTAIAETRETDFEIVVIDNASEDGSAAAIAAAFPQVRLMAERENHGFAAANNIAIAAHARGRYILLLNPDTVVLDGAIDRLMAFARRTPAARIWGGRTLYGDRALNPTNAWAAQTPWSVFCRVSGLATIRPESALFNPEGYGGWARDSEREVDIVTGCFLLIERAFWDRLGGFDLDYVMYGEEADLCLRARAFGARPRFTPEAEIVHYVGASQAVFAHKIQSVVQAKITLARRHMPPAARGLTVLMLRLLPASRNWASRIMLALRGGPAWQARHAAWAEVWARRAEWREGYPPRGKERR